jgi:hypothetical protein
MTGNACLWTKVSIDHPVAIRKNKGIAVEYKNSVIGEKL